MTNPNDPAFVDSMGEGFKMGLTKREFFAVEIMKGIVTLGLGCWSPIVPGKTEDDLVKANNSVMAKKSIELAEALIEGLNKEKPHAN